MKAFETRRVSRLSSVVEQRTLTPTSSIATNAGAVFRADTTDAGVKQFVGHAAVFDARTAIGNPRSWWGFYEELDPGCFDKTLTECDARMLIDHDTALLVARQTAGDLHLQTDTIGLLTEADLDEEVSYIRDLARNLEKRRLTGMSFSFQAVRDAWTTEEEVVDNKVVEVEVRRILEARLHEVSVVTFPAYDQTDASLRSMIAAVRRDRLGQTPPASSRIREDDPAPADATRDSEVDETPALATSRRNDEGLELEEQLLAARYRLS